MSMFYLPFPPTVNQLYRNPPRPHMKRPKTKQYLSWIKEAGVELAMQRIKPIRGPVRIVYELQDDASGKNVLWDYANREKALTDLLVEHRIIEADHRKIVKELTVRGTKNKIGVRVMIEPYVEEIAVF